MEQGSLRAWRCTVLTAVAGTFVLALPLFRYPYHWDQGHYAALVDLLRDGGVAFRDAFDLRPPGTVYAYYWSSVLFGRSPHSIRLLEILCLLLTSWGIVEVARNRLASRAAALTAGLSFPLMYLRFSYGDTAESETFMLPFMTWGLALSSRGWLTAGPCLRTLGVGGLHGMALLFKPTYLLVPLAAAMLEFFRAGEADSRPRWRRVALFACGLAAPTALICAYYGIRGALAPAFEAVVVHAGNYAVGYLGQSGLGEVLKRQAITLRDVFGAGAGAFALLGLLRGVRVAPRPSLEFCVLGLAAALGGVAQFRAYQFHFMTVLPMAALLIGLNAFWMPVLWPLARPTRTLARAALALFGLAMIGLAIRDYFLVTRPFWADLAGDPRSEFPEEQDYHQPILKASREIRSRLGTADRLFVWGNEPLLYYHADRRAATRFVEIAPVVARWRSGAGEAEVLEALRRAPPGLIVTCRRDALPDACGWREDSESLLESFGGMKALLSSGYVKGSEIGNYRIWIRRP